MKLKFEHNAHRHVPIDESHENGVLLKKLRDKMEGWGAVGEFGSYAVSLDPRHPHLGYSASFKGADGYTMHLGHFKTLKAAMRKLQKLETSQAAVST